MSVVIEIAAIAAGTLVVLFVMAVIRGREDRRKNNRFYDVLDMIQNSKDPDEMIAIRDAYREELGNPLNR